MSRRNNKQQPRVFDVEIDALDEEGLGVARAPHADVRVKGVVPGERVEVRVLTRRGPSRLAVPLAWRRAEPRRTKPACRSFMTCGGCSLQHVDAAEQLALKEKWLFSELDAVGVDAESRTAAVSGPQLLYRRKARISGRHLADAGEFLLGFHESFSGKIARMEECLVLAEPFSSGFRALRSALGKLSIVHAIPQIEIAVGDTSSTLVIRHLEPPSRSDLERLREIAAQLRTNVLLQGDASTQLQSLDGDDATDTTLDYRLDAFGVSLAFGPLDFVQVNRTVNERLVAAAVTALDPRPDERVLDLFCGIGNFTLPLGRRSAHVVGVEASEDAVRRARTNAASNALERRIDVRAVDLYATPLPDAGGATKVLVDPPRSGIGRSIATLADARIQRIGYVSCEPRTFALDAAALAKLGYQLTQCGVFDMFPHTSHVETLGVFERYA